MDREITITLSSLGLRERAEANKNRHPLSQTPCRVSLLREPIQMLLNGRTNPRRSDPINGLRSDEVTFQHREPPCAYWRSARSSRRMRNGSLRYVASRSQGSKQRLPPSRFGHITLAGTSQPTCWEQHGGCSTVDKTSTNPRI